MLCAGSTGNVPCLRLLPFHVSQAMNPGAAQNKDALPLTFCVGLKASQQPSRQAAEAQGLDVAHIRTKISVGAMGVGRHRINNQLLDVLIQPKEPLQRRLCSFVCSSNPSSSQARVEEALQQ